MQTCVYRHVELMQAYLLVNRDTMDMQADMLIQVYALKGIQSFSCQMFCV